MCFYDPLSNEGEQWRELARQSSLEEYINDQIRQGKLKRNVIEIDNEKITQYIKPAIHEPYFSSEERVASDRELFEEWLHYVMPVQIHLNVHALDFLSQNRFDLTLENDSDFPDHIRQGKIQKVQFDGKNCVPISFFMNAVRYAAKPGDNEFKKRGIAKFLEDFGVRILTREEILG